MQKERTCYQHDSKDCGPACLRMIVRHYGKDIPLKKLRELSFITREGVSMLGLSEAAERLGMKTLGAKITLQQLADEILLPCILHWNQNHFIVCRKVTGSKGNKRFHIDDPEMGKVCYNESEMKQHWISGTLNGEDIGLAMQIQPGNDFGLYEYDEKEYGLRNFLRYITPYKKRIGLLLMGTIVTLLLSYMAPFFSQAVVDVGIKNRDINFIVLIMVVQVIMALSQTMVGFVQSWISLRINSIINLNLISDYLKNLTAMPIVFFEIKTLGDILQRINDHARIKSFLMNNVVNIVFAVGTFIVFSIVLAVYNIEIFITFMVGNALYVIWVLAFMKYRKVLDHKIFSQSSRLQNNLVQFTQGMPEIKLNNMEVRKRWEWEHLQAGMFRISMQTLRLGQIQSVGTILFSNLTGIIISYIAARMVVNEEITLGMMMSLSFILGQVSGPIASFLGFAQSYQDARISLERLGEINDQAEKSNEDDSKLMSLPSNQDLALDNVSFSYNGSERSTVLHDVSIVIPEHKITAIVGASGSGKTTLLKLLQGFYNPQKGVVKIGDTPLFAIHQNYWRKQIGSVMQDGFIFSDSIANNICVDSDELDLKRLIQTTDMVNLTSFIMSLPLNFNTKIGAEGIGLSQGQKQRILLARAIYKNPEFIFMDEATNALDAKNEHEIVENLNKFYNGKTVVVVAHRLSTIKNADNIIVLDKGRIVETGIHNELINKKGHYYELIKNQLELENIYGEK